MQQHQEQSASTYNNSYAQYDAGNLVLAVPPLNGTDSPADEDWGPNTDTWNAASTANWVGTTAGAMESGW